MPDDPRPASGQQSEPRPTAGAPSWWGSLGRPDLPLDGVDGPSPSLQPAPPAHTPPQRSTAQRWRGWAFNAAVLIVAVLIVCVGLGAISLRMFLTATLIFGVPLVLATLTATVITRRSR